MKVSVDRFGTCAATPKNRLTCQTIVLPLDGAPSAPKCGAGCVFGNDVSAKRAIINSANKATRTVALRMSLDSARRKAIVEAAKGTRFQWFSLGRALVG